MSVLAALTIPLQPQLIALPTHCLLLLRQLQLGREGLLRDCVSLKTELNIGIRSKAWMLKASTLEVGRSSLAASSCLSYMIFMIE